MTGVYLEIAEPERLTYTSGALDANGRQLFEFLHAVTFVERNGKTTLTITSRLVKTTADASKYVSGFRAGMSQSLEKLAETLSLAPGTLVIERVFQAPVATVWEALTTAEGITQWFVELKEFKAEPGYEFQWSCQHKAIAYIHLCRITTVVPRQKLAYTWRYDGYAGESLVSIELFTEGHGTRLKLTHSGLDTFPAIPDFARENFLMGWTKIIGENLKQTVESATPCTTA
jgi:uncharacterized protein YndB with AHSA1/START domain